MPQGAGGPIVAPTPGVLVLPFNWGDGVLPIVTPSVKLAVIQGNFPLPGNLEDGDRIFIAAGWMTKQDRNAAQTGATFSIDFALGCNTAVAPWQSLAGTMPSIPAGPGEGTATNQLDWDFGLPNPLQVRDNSVIAVTLLTAPVDAVNIALGIVFTVF